MLKTLSLKASIILQSVVVMLPIALLLGYQTVSDIRQAERLSDVFRAHQLSSDATAQYKNFVDGVVDGVDTGRIATKAVSSLNEASIKLTSLQRMAPHVDLTGLVQKFKSIVAAIAGDTSIKSVQPIQSTISKLNEELRSVDIQFEGIARQATEEATAASKRQQRIILGAIPVTILLCGLLIRNLVKRLTDGWQRSIKIADAIARGDLTSRITVHGDDETAKLLSALGRMNVSLKTIVRGVRVGADNVVTSSSELSAGTQNLSRRTEEQASTLEETAASLEELTTTVSQNAENAREASRLAVAASEVARKGGEVVDAVVSTMDEISSASKKIGEINAVIDGIAFQTNILALNAAVEAARAGEHGRGFAVVAAEVRNLAMRSAAAAKEIKELIGDSAKKVRTGTDLVDSAGHTMVDVVLAIKSVSDLIAEIAAASQEQSLGIKQVNTAVTQMDRVVQENAAMVEEATAATEAMSAQAISLQQMVATFNVDRQSTDDTQLQAVHRVVPRPLTSSWTAARRPHPAAT